MRVWSSAEDPTARAMARAPTITCIAASNSRYSRIYSCTKILCVLYHGYFILLCFITSGA